MDYVEQTCHDCGVNVLGIDEYFMVEDEVWLASGLALDGGHLCVGCLEERLGRRLSPYDFTDVQCNYSSFRPQSERLRDRLA